MVYVVISERISTAVRYQRVGIIAKCAHFLCDFCTFALWGISGSAFSAKFWARIRAHSHDFEAKLPACKTSTCGYTQESYHSEEMEVKVRTFHLGYLSNIISGENVYVFA